jgi:hypothetical protein
MTRRNKGMTSGAVVLAAELIGAFTILFAAPLLFLLTDMSWAVRRHLLPPALLMGRSDIDLRYT